MDPSVSVVILPLRGGRPLRETVASVTRQSGRVADILLVDQPGLDERVRRALPTLTTRAGVGLVQSATEAPGACRNAGVRAARSPYVTCLEEGETVDTTYCEKVAARLDRDPVLALVSTWVLDAADGPGGALSTPPRLTLETALRGPWEIPASAAFRRAVWAELGGFDEALPDLDVYDLWLRILERGYTGEIIDERLVRRARRPESRYRRLLEGDRYERAIRQLVARHEATFAAAGTRVLQEREGTFVALLETHRRLARRREGAVAELYALRQEAARLTALLREAGRDGVEWGDLRRTRPLSPDWGYDRGKPVDRYYIERFLETHARDVHGVVLEVQENDLTLRLGEDRVTRSDVVDIDPGNLRATIVADLRKASAIPSDTYDCVILTQTLHVIDDMRAVLAECRRMLKPGGALLATLPCASRVGLEHGCDGDFWRVTEAGARSLFGEAFGPGQIQVRAYGNVLVNAAFLYGLACHELTTDELEAWDPYFPLLVGVRALKPGVAPAGAVDAAATGDARPGVRAGQPGTGRAVILLYHRVVELGLDTHGLAVGTEEFWDQMAHLARHYQPVALDELAADARDGRLPRGAVAVTFDDGYADNVTTASPILGEFRVPATFFVGGDPGEAPCEFWWDTLERILLGSPHLPPVLELELGGTPARLPTGTREARLSAYGAVYRAIAGWPLEARDAVMAGLLAWSGLDPSPRTSHRLMTASEVRRLAARPGHAIGAHGLHHLALARQPLAVQRQEVRQSKAAIEAVLSRPVTAFAYPFGDVTDETAAVLREASFHLGLTREETAVRPGANPLRLPRLEVKAWDREGFAALLRRWLDGE